MGRLKKTKNVMNTSIKLILLVGMLSTSPARSDILIYTATQSSHIIGQGMDRHISSSGFVIFDYDNGGAYNVSHYKLSGINYFSVQSIPSVRIYQVTGVGGRNYTAFMTRGITNTATYYEDFNGFGMGLNADLQISSSRTVQFPKTIAGAPRGATVPNGQAPLFENDVSTFTFSRKATQTANASGQSAQAAANGFAAKFQALGYLQIQ